MTKQESLVLMEQAFAKLCLTRPGTPAHRIATLAFSAAAAAYDAAPPAKE